MHTLEGWIYLCVVIDIYTRKILGWTLKSKMDKDIVISALRKALNRTEKVTDLIFHSDRGSQYTCFDLINNIFKKK